LYGLEDLQVTDTVPPVIGMTASETAVPCKEQLLHFQKLHSSCTVLPASEIATF
jgi:hypothetical protein